MKDYLGINTKLVTSSSIEINHSLKSEEKVIEICKSQNAATYINPIGGLELYNKNSFNQYGIELNFIKSKPLEYKQFNNEFIPNLSIIDVFMFNSIEQIKDMLNQYELL